MINVNKLKGKIVERGLNVKGLAEKIGMDASTLYRKLSKGGETFTIKEALCISKELKLNNEEAISIFFTHNVASDAKNTA